MRIRAIKPSFFASLTLDVVSDAARLTFAGLWCYCDDEGRGIDDVRLIKAAIWPLSRSPKQIDAYLDELAVVEVICRYKSAPRPLLHIVNWHEHQRVSHPQPSVLAACSIPEHSGIIPESDLNGTGGKRERARNQS